MANSDAELRIGANIDDLKSAAEKAATEVKRMAGAMESAMAPLVGVFSKVQGQFAALAAVMAGGAAFQKSIEAVKEQTFTALGLSKQLGITAAEANVLNAALENAHISTETYTGAVHGVTRAINNNEQGFKQLGIRVRDTSGNILPMQEIIRNTVEKLEDFKAGADRNIMANQLLGKSYDDVVTLMRLTDEAFADARQEVDEYHKRVDPEAVKAYAKAHKDAKDAVEGVTLAVGRGAMPMFTQLSQWFAEIGPTATEITIVAMDTLRDVFESVTTVVREVYGVIRDAMREAADIIEQSLGVRVAGVGETFVNVMRMIRLVVLGFADAAELSFAGIRGAIEILVAVLNRFSGVARAAFSLRWGDIKAEWEAGGKAIEDAVNRSAERIAKIHEKYQAKMGEAAMGGFDRGGGSDTKAPKGGSKNSFTLDDGSGSKDKSRMSEWESALAMEKVYFQKSNDLKEFSKEQEKAYWEQILRTKNVSEQERVAITKKTAELELEIMKKAVQERKGLNEESINASEKVMLDALARDEQSAQAEMDLGRITKEELLSQQKQFEDRRFEIQREAQAARINAMQGDPNMDPVAFQKLQDQLAEIQRAHVLRSEKIQQDAAINAKNQWEQMLSPITSAIEKSVTGMIMGTTTLKKAMSNLFQSILGEFVSLVSKMVMKWAAGELAKTTLLKEGSLMRLALEKMGLIESAAAKTAATTNEVVTNEIAAQSGAGLAAVNAMASVAAIPFIGWMMAPGVGAETYAVAEGFAATAAASGGYDIPSGVNPITQLHQEEMVLPAHIANPLRDSLAGGGMSGGAVHFTVNAVDSASVERLFKDNGHILAREMRRQARNFTPRNV